MNKSFFSLLLCLIFINSFSQSIYSKLVNSNDDILFGNFNANFVSFNLLSKKNNWEFNTEDKIYAEATIYDNKVFFSDNLSNVYCLNLKDGKKTWQTNLNTFAPIVNQIEITNSTAFVSSANNLIAINITNGEIIWKKSFQGAISSQISIYENKIFFGTITGHIYIFDLNGKELARLDEMGKIWGKILVENDFIYFGNNSKTFIKYDYLKRQKIFQILTNDWISMKPIFVENNIIFCNDSGEIFSIDKNGNTNWKQDTKFAIRTEPLYFNNSLYLINDDKKIIILENKTGKIQDEILTKAQVKSGAISYKKSILFADLDGNIYQKKDDQKALDIIFKSKEANLIDLPKIQETIK